MTNIESFFKRTSEDQDLQEELSKALEAKEGNDIVRAICDVAKNHGFALSIEETSAAVRAIAEKYAEGQELDDGELEGVAGGMFRARDVSALMKWRS